MAAVPSGPSLDSTPHYTQFANFIGHLGLSGHSNEEGFDGIDRRVRWERQCKQNSGREDRKRKRIRLYKIMLDLKGIGARVGVALSCRKADCCVSSVEPSGSTGSVLESKIAYTNKTSTKEFTNIAEFVEKLLWWQTHQCDDIYYFFWYRKRSSLNLFN
jgi:hypothetical protein